MTVLASKQIYCINDALRNNPDISIDDYCGQFVDIEDIAVGEEEGNSPLPNSTLNPCLLSRMRFP